MGSFDKVYAKCPACKSELEVQTKAGDCKFEEYRIEEGVPMAIAASLRDEETVTCRCGRKFKFITPYVPELVTLELRQIGE